MNCFVRAKELSYSYGYKNGEGMCLSGQGNLAHECNVMNLIPGGMLYP